MADLEVGKLREGSASFLEVNEELIEFIVHSKDDLRENEIHNLIKNYFKISLTSLELCPTLDTCSEHAIASKSVIEMVLKPEDVSKEAYCRKLYVVDVLEKMRMVHNACQLLVENFSSTYPPIHDQQLLCLENIEEKKKNLDRRLKPANRWAKISIAIFGTAYVGTIVGSLVEAALDAPQAAALALASGTPILDLFAQWFRSHRTDKAKKLIEEQAIVAPMDVATRALGEEFEKMWEYVDELKAWIETFVQKEDEYKSAMKEDDDDSSTMDAMKEMKKLVDVFINTIQGLTDHISKCRNEIKVNMDEILHKTINYPNNSTHGPTWCCY